MIAVRSRDAFAINTYEACSIDGAAIGAELVAMIAGSAIRGVIDLTLAARRELDTAAETKHGAISS